ncbi:MAG: hypothetical protein ACK5TN_21635 [Acidobacteriota bacterium]|jgi:hypothetical protein
MKITSRQVQESFTSYVIVEADLRLAPERFRGLTEAFEKRAGRTRTTLAQWMPQ